MNDGLTVETFRQTVADIESEVGKLIVGQRTVLRHVLIALLAGGHVLLEGVPGLGKTMLVRTLGQVLALQFSRVQFTPDLMPADITGTDIMEEQPSGQRVFRFQRGPLFANLVLADEINRATPKTQSALLEAMQEHTVTVANETYPLPEPFFVLATQNPLEMEGTYPLPEAQLDRFLFKVNVLFPSESELGQILERTTGRTLPRIAAVADAGRILAMQDLARQVPMATHVGAYISRLVVNSHPQASASTLVTDYVRYGASPRAAQALALGSKITALFEGRLNVAFEDVEAIATAALRHRLLLNFEGQAEGVSSDDVVADLLTTVPKE
ncbi:MAG: MoxR family ATPase [Candidatus Promineifilaceae bacterium]|nr:MoxR family ATPase [Candidatus Promineifilaceae bacterium]